MSYLAKTEQASWRQRLQRAYNRPDYDEARAALETLHRELEDRNQSAARSLAEGFDETLTLHRLGLYGRSGPLAEDDELSGVRQCARRGTLREGRSLAKLASTSPLAGDRALGHRTAPAQGDGIPAPAHAPCRVEARTEDRHDDVEEESRVVNQEP